MALRFLNTYSRKLEEFRPRDPDNRSPRDESVRPADKIDIYTCGPTVYSRAHIGNFRAYIFEDLLQRHFAARAKPKFLSRSLHSNSKTRSSKMRKNCGSNARMIIRLQPINITSTK